MEPDKNTTPDTEGNKPNSDQQAPADALSRTPEDLEQEAATQKAASGVADEPAEKPVSPLKRFMRRVNVYLLLFLLLVVVSGVVIAVNYLNSQKTSNVTPASTEPNIASQKLTEDALKQLANTDTSVGSASQTLTIQGNAIIEGQTLMRGNLNVAGNFQSGGRIQGPSLTISGESNLGTAQINSLQVAQNVAIQGATTVRDLSVAGGATFAGAVTASQITVSKLVLSGNSSIEIPNHLAFTGPNPGRAPNAGVLGAGGSASVSGSDSAGTVNINTGNGPSVGCFVRVNFNQAYATSPRVIISPIGAGAGLSTYYVDRNNSGFSICAASTPPANSAFAFDYFVTG
ncbi:hypothetical protein GII36_05510 [Candidatus Mycosynbacter amalyticus]|uniref:Polymer-forming cytoskeletal protein n=1 Tax=Candidatus Mycosynbacter amalyticus TaxID=2665156 RepID=A0A857MN44_9BACT|nr:hypothetical protein [Candidatus Mycosynbacter amalyticus]QHN43275.1 hypothetical protein GII36_05510 [Candidatus Mycosynbacter amalyticus]